ncbi:MAG: DUF412 domain-containing protein [Cohaesibacter sp.]|nr:DUF412 domain-containing protein [Cohaesibacter sp.]
MAKDIGYLFREGQAYSQTWPVKRELYALFPECRVIAATRFANKVMPPLAILTAAVYINFYGLDFLPQALTMAFFFISLPMQGLLWLGYRANQPLPPSTQSWYRDIHHKMQMQGCRVHAVKGRPRYKELAQLLKTAFDEMDKAFTRQWF